MPKLYLLTVLSPNYIWLCSTIAANMPKGLALGPVDRWLSIQNTRFWYDSDKMDAEFTTLKNTITGGKDVLLMGGSPDPASHLALYEALRKHGLSEIAEIKPVFVVARPSLLLNFYCENWANKMDAGIMLDALHYVSDIPTTIETSISEWRRENIETVIDLSEFAGRQNALNLANRLFSSWGYGECVNDARMTMSYRFFSSATAMRLVLAATVRDNDWPRMDDLNFLSVLEAYDAKWYPEPICPVDFRLENRSAISVIEEQVETLLEVKPGTMTAPDWFWQVAALLPNESLDDDRLDKFACALSSDVATILGRRFAIDEPLLTPDQRQLWAALGRRGNDFRHIGSTHEKPVMTVLTMARNHEKYIAECMESVLAQKTNFPVQHLVLDHYSTDGTPEIINEYAARYPTIRPVLLKYGQGFDNVRELLNRCRSGYAALCDGDDYFIDENKLQLQVDFLRENRDCALVFHPVKVIFEDGTQPMIFPGASTLPRGVHKKYYLMDLVKGNMIQTNTVVYRWRFRDGLPDWFKCKLCPGDWYWHLLHAEIGKIGFIPRLMSVYRRHANALFRHSFRDQHKHRMLHGMKELEAYDEFNKHFNDHYFEQFAMLAAGVLANFMEISLNLGESELFDRAMEKYPRFGLYFLKHVKPVKISRRKTGQSGAEG